MANTQIRGEQIKDAFFGAGLARNGSDGNIADVQVDGSTLEITADALNIANGGVDTLQLADDSVTKEKVASDVAGNGILQNVDGSLELNPDDSSIEIGSGEVLRVKALGVTNDMLAGSIAFSKMVNLTTNRALVSDGNGDVSVSVVTDTEIGYLDGVTSGIQAQIDALSTGYDRRKAVINVVDNTAVPPTEVSGDRYILDDTGGGVHANWDGASVNDIVEFNGATWVAASPTEGWVAYVDSQDVDALFIDDGSPQWQFRSVISSALANGDIFIGNGSGVATAQTMQGDATIINDGTLTIANDAVDNNKLANMTQGTVKVGGGSNAPTDLDAKTDGYMLIGDGTDINSVEVTGDITITNAGVTAIGADKVTKEMINSDVAGVGILQNVDGSLELNVDDSTIEIASGEVLQVKALGITNSHIANDTIAEAKLDVFNAPTQGYVLGYTSNGLEWIAGTTSGVSESDIQVENESANCNGATVVFTISSTPIANSVQVFLNGLLQEEGSGKDYTITGTSITFTEAPFADDILLVHYIIDI